MKTYKKILVAALLGVVSVSANAQDDNTDAHNIVVSIPEVALLDLEASAGTSIELGPDAPLEAGEMVSFPSQDNSIWLNYSSIVGSTTEPSRNVTVQISSGSVPAGTFIEVEAAADAGNGDGTMGAPSSALTLSTAPQNILTAIGSAYTGDGVNNGHNLSYSLDLLPAARVSDERFCF
jgi:hypothetical protein